MRSISRRRFLLGCGRLGAVALASSWMAPRGLAHQPGRAIGIQLYTVAEPLREDQAGTLGKLAGMGFAEVETATDFKRLEAAAFRRLLDDAGLRCPSAHLPLDAGSIDRSLDSAQALGARYVVSSSLQSAVGAQRGKRAKSAAGMSLEEAKRTAELANRIGERAKRAGLRYAYHNHQREFADQGDGAIAYDLLLRQTDPDLVRFQIDCGWMVVGGRDPVTYFQRHPGRFPSIHVKDFAKPEDGDAGAAPRGTELGTGMVDYRPIVAAATAAGVEHYFAEQEGPFTRMEQLQAAKVAYAYLHGIG
ncbi:sugar phosphate isomerase/epimerase family protein [Luteimonas aquatica]|uniref:sugar phosphate isomerase/epimerase family protein n=1 Tax=Luteimonas aquatica TaxID=450364 RepID=UPI001F592E16|nr:sugar phosphate isomerase/epimerase [Luteimonas aquatica]